MNLSKGHLYIPTSKAFVKGEVIKVLINIQPTMDVIRAEAKVIKQEKRSMDDQYPWGIVVKLLKFEKNDKKKLLDYLRLLEKTLRKR